MTNLVILGGFLGSGKTTLMTKLGQELTQKGKKVAFITNDQGGFLVDTAYTQKLGIITKEVKGGCFCCNFPLLIDNITAIAQEHHPDYIFAEAVGSCTDITSTVILPLREHHPGLVKNIEFFVLADGARIVDEYKAMNLNDPKSPKEVLISHQLKEAGRILLSRCDFLDDDEMEEGLNLLRMINPNAALSCVSSRFDIGIDSLLEVIETESVNTIDRTIALDYDLYAQAEAEYGWYNGKWTFIGNLIGTPADYAAEIIEKLGSHSKIGNIAHGKILVASGNSVVKTSYSGGKIEKEVAKLEDGLNKNEVILNVRAENTPETISDIVQEIIESLNPKPEDYTFSSFIPAPPKPTYRIQKEGQP